MKNYPIDAVITWVDGGDPEHRKKMRKYAPATCFKEDDIAGKTRFASIGEIYWCVASLRKFAPFLRKIFIVTDGQDPQIPEGNIPVEIVDHKTIFQGYEKYLPVFNSIAIETMTWRIPGLAEHYIELNDDFMLCAPIKESDLFVEEDVPICYAKKHSIPFDIVTRAIKPKIHGRNKVTFKGVMCNGAILAGAWLTYLRLNHTPRPLLKSFFEKYYAEHPETLERNIGYRFRDARQFSSEELQYVSLRKQKKSLLKDYCKVLFYMEPKKKHNYIPRKLEKLKAGNYLFCCFNSLDKAGAKDRKLVTSTIDAILA